MANYTGEKAYVVVSLINPDGKYVKTLYVQGDDPEWFPDLKNWWESEKVKKVLKDFSDSYVRIDKDVDNKIFKILKNEKSKLTR